MLAGAARLIIRFMSMLPRRTGWWVALVAALALTVVSLAAIQYRWIGQLAEAERERLRARLATSVDVFRDSFNRELFQLLVAFRRDSFPQGTVYVERYARAFEDWLDVTAHPRLVRSFWVARSSGEGRLDGFLFDASSRRLLPAALPAGVANLARACVARRSADSVPTERFVPPAAWNFTFTDQGPMLVRVLYRQGQPTERPAQKPPQTIGYLFLGLNEQYIQRELFPELAHRAFGDPSHSAYRLAVFRGSSAGEEIYSSSSQPGQAAFKTSDVETGLFGDDERQGPGGSNLRGRERVESLPPRPRLFVARCNAEDQWVLAVRHEAGSVNLAALRLRKHNLAISSGVLILLTLSIVMIVVSTQRAQRLARMQMQFAAGISHEVRTPLAVIRSAGDNLAEGVVESREQVKEYGDLVRREGRRLSNLVEQALQFAALHAGDRRYELTPVDVSVVIQSALAGLAPMIEESGFRVENHVAARLPSVGANAEALSRCVQNLIANALKYGGEARWAEIRVEPGEGPYTVKISVSDHGPGIPAADLPNIFDPFYQGSVPGGVKSGGVGLGLSLTKDMIEAMGGKIGVETKPGRGTTFTLYLRPAGGSTVSSHGTQDSAG